jgi:hypothetical protein
VFYAQLRSSPIDLDDFTQALRALSGAPLDAIRAALPTAWNNEEAVKIDRRLRTIADHAGEFAEEVKRQLA